MTIRAILLAFTALWVLAHPAAAEPLVDESQLFVIDVPDNFVATPKGAALYRFSGDSGMRLSVTRIDAANLRAYWRHQRGDFFAELERGAARVSTGYRLKSKKYHREGRTPIFDLHFERDHNGERELVWMRFLLRRRFAIVATLTAPAKAKRRVRKAAAQLATSLMPNKNSAD